MLSKSIKNKLLLFASCAFLFSQVYGMLNNQTNQNNQQTTQAYYLSLDELLEPIERYVEGFQGVSTLTKDGLKEFRSDIQKIKRYYGGDTALEQRISDLVNTLKNKADEHNISLNCRTTRTGGLYVTLKNYYDKLRQVSDRRDGYVPNLNRETNIRDREEFEIDNDFDNTSIEQPDQQQRRVEDETLNVASNNNNGDQGVIVNPENNITSMIQSTNQQGDSSQEDRRDDQQETRQSFLSNKKFLCLATVTVIVAGTAITCDYLYNNMNCTGYILSSLGKGSTWMLQVFKNGIVTAYNGAQDAIIYLKKLASCNVFFHKILDRYGEQISKLEKVSKSDPDILTKIISDLTFVKGNITQTQCNNEVALLDRVVGLVKRVNALMPKDNTTLREPRGLITKFYVAFGSYTGKAISSLWSYLPFGKNE